ncbi:MAG: hypothetical protein GQ531_00415 [Sulfurovum sp.]|nr:hypothetical protein [Sulfurovum sp.]
MAESGSKKLSIVVWIGILLFVVFYPMLISIYVFLPLFIAAMSYLFIQGLEQGRYSYILVSMVYLINLEVNLSLPLFFTLISALIFYVTIYPSLLHFRKCKLCKAFISVLILDLAYLGALFAYDFIFNVNSIELDMILLYSLVVDMLLVVLL